MTRKRYSQSARRTSSTTAVVMLLLLAALVLGGCCGIWALIQAMVGALGGDGIGGPEPVVLTVAYSPEKAELFTALVEDFNAQQPTTPDGVLIRVEVVELEPEMMLEAALAGEFQALTPDSSLWLNQLDILYADRVNDPHATLVGQTVRYAVSPIVIALWRDVAVELGWPERALGWSDLLARAQADPNFKWSHPSTSSAAGLLAVLAEFYAGAGVTRGLTPEMVQAQETLDYVAAIERTVRYYGEGEWAVVQRILEEGQGYLDAFVCQEQLVVYANQRGADLVAIYPVEGSLWEDHPLALLETAALDDEQRLAFTQFAAYLASEEAQRRVLAAGYRPADLSISLDDPASPITPTNGADPDQPQTMLQVPGAAVVQVVRDVWWYTKRHTNVYLVVDTSGSMEGQKLESVREALRIFVEQIQGDQERVGLVEFYTYATVRVPLDELGDNRAELLATIDSLEAGGDTALVDGVWMAYQELQWLNDTERINAIVVMTDGLENNSDMSLWELQTRMREGNASGVRVVVFAIGYGSDADWDTLEAIAEATQGQVHEGTVETIRQLYKVLSTYFSQGASHKRQVADGRDD